MDIFTLFFYQPIYNIVIIFYHLLGDNLGLAIIAIGLISRVIMIPITRRQIKMAESSREFSEKMKSVKEKHKKNKEKQQEELLKLQQEYLPSQLAGCLPLIFQVVLFIFIYRVLDNLIKIINQPVNAIDGFNNVAYNFVPAFQTTYNISPDFLGIVDLTKSAASVTANGFDLVSALPYLILIILVALTNYYSLKVTTAMGKKKSENKPEVKKKDKDAPDDFNEIMQQSTKTTMLMMPFLLAFISYGVPSGLSIYLITTSLFVIIQKLVMDRLESQETQK